jgi:hypothetical protein
MIYQTQGSTGEGGGVTGEATWSPPLVEYRHFLLLKKCIDVHFWAFNFAFLGRKIQKQNFGSTN